MDNSLFTQHHVPLPKLIITAASGKYGDSLLALVGSIECNWPDHPPLRVYDIGLFPQQRQFLEKHQYEVVDVPPFCPHWRQHYAWKIWCMNDAPADNVLWIDAGICVLNSLDDVFEKIELHGYFAVHNFQKLEQEASDSACEGCKVAKDFKSGKKSIAAGFIGFNKTYPVMLKLLSNALQVASVEKYIKAYAPTHRQDQAILSILLYKYASPLIINDPDFYLNCDSPRHVPGQKTWLHRRYMLPEDVLFLKKCIVVNRKRHIPKDPKKDISRLRFILRRSVFHLKVLIKRLLSKKRINDGCR